MCYILLYVACYITCCVEAALLDQPRIENQWCYIAGNIPQHIARAILSAIQNWVMLYSMSIYHAIQQIRLYSSPHICIYHAIQQVRLYIFPHIWHFAVQHIYIMLYSTCIYHPIQLVRLYSFPHIQHLAIQHIFYAIQHMQIASAIQHPAIQHIDQLYSNAYSSVKAIQHPCKLQHDPRFQIPAGSSARWGVHIFRKYAK